MNIPEKHIYKKQIYVFAAAMTVLAATLSGCGTDTHVTETSQQERPTSVVYTLSEQENKDYDVSIYRITNRSFYEEPQTAVTKDQLKEYAGSKLDTITQTADKYYVGTYQNYEFTIVAVDGFSEWITSMGYSDRNGNEDGLYLQRHLGNLEYETTDYFKDPSGKFLIVTQCRDNKVICEFFEGMNGQY
jgi:hypothetical protein